MNVPDFILSDQLDCAKAQKELLLRGAFMTTDGFVNLEHLAETQSQSPPIVVENQEFITNTELLDACNNAEFESSKSNLFTETVSTSKQSILIAAIIDDFCSSEANQYAEHIDYAAEPLPYFRFRSKAIRTYNRKPNCDNNIVQYNDCLSNCSSSLSVQEDCTVEPSADYIDVYDCNTSQRLCENLLNLSVYYTQNSLQEAQQSNDNKTNQDTLAIGTSESFLPLFATAKEVIPNSINRLIDMPLDCSDASLIPEDFSLREPNNCCCNSSEIYEDFHWYNNEIYQENIEHWLSINDNNGLPDVDEGNKQIFQDFGLMRIKYLNSENISFNKKEETMKKLTTGEEMFNDDDILAILNDDSFGDVEPLISDIALNCLQNHEPPDNLNASNKNNNSQTHNSYSKVNMNTSQNVNLTQMAFKAAISSKSQSSFLTGFRTGANKVIEVSEKTIKRVDTLLQKLPQIKDNDIHKVPKTEDASTHKLNVQPLEENVSTSRQIEKDAIEDLLKGIDGIENVLLSDWDAVLPNDIPTSQPTPKQTPFVGFCTASRKSIQISDKSIQRAVNILAEQQEIPTKKKYSEQMINPEQDLNRSIGQEKVYGSTKDIEHISTNSIKINIPIIFNIDAEKTKVSLKENLGSCGNRHKTPISGKRKLAHCAYTDKISPNPNKLRRKSHTLSNSNTSKTSTEHEHMKFSLTQLSQQSPLTKCDTSSIISRKNLLSLSRRHNQKQRPNQRSLNSHSRLAGAFSDISETVTPNRQKQKLNMNEIRTPVKKNAKEIFLDDLANLTSTPLPNVDKVADNLTCLKSDFQKIDWENDTLTCAANCDRKSLQIPNFVGTPDISPICMTMRSHVCRGPGLRRNHSTSEKKGNFEDTING